MKEASRNHLIFSVVACFLAVLSISFTWRSSGIPPEWPWPGNPLPLAALKFFSFWIPLNYLLFSFACVLLPVLLKGLEEKKLRRLDAYTYLLLPVFILFELSWRHIDNLHLWLGGFYLFLVFIKSLPLLYFIYLRAKILGSRAVSGAKPQFNIKLSLIIVFFLIYGSLAGWQDLSISTTGDEPYYLIIAHSLARDGDFELSNNFQDRDYSRFYWVKQLYPYQNMVKTEEGRLFSVAYNGFAVFLLPAYALLGRVGATLLTALFAALTVGEIFSISSRATKSPVSAYYSCLFLGLTSPFLFFSLQIYPEVVAAFFALWSARKIWELPHRRKVDLLGIAAVLIILPILQARLIPISLAIFLLFLIYIRQKKILIGAILLAIILTGAAVLSDEFFFQGLLFSENLNTRGSLTNITRLISVNLSGFVRNTLAFLFDQEFGLLFYSPLYLLSFFGLPFALKGNKHILLIAGAIILIYAYFLERLGRWYGGFSLPSRYIVCVLPLTGFLVAMALKKIKLYSFKILVLMLSMWSFIVSFMLLLMPRWRYNNFDGSTQLLEHLGRRLSINLVRFLPSFNGITPLSYRAMMFSITAIVCSGLYFYLRSRWLSIKREDIERPVNSVLAFSVAFLLLAVGFSTVAFMARVVPTAVLEGESMLRSTGVIYTDYATGSVWVMKKRGTLHDDIILREGESEIELIAGGYSTDGVPPHITVSLDGQKVGEFGILAGKGKWRRESYRFRVKTSKGRHQLQIEFENGSSEREAQRYLYIDRVIIREVAN